MGDTATIANEHLLAEVAMLGAELAVLRSTSGHDFLWNGDPAWWRGRSPLLFPIVGKVPDDHILVDGVCYPLRQHGLARISEFALVETSEHACRFELTSSAQTRAAYPFDFTLEVAYSLAGPSLTIAATVVNTGGRDMPVSFGFHPAFRWPLPGGGPRDAHVLTFDEEEKAPIRRLHNGLLTAQPLPTPVRGRTLSLHDDLFKEDALIFDRPVSRGLTYSSPGGPSLRVEFPDMPNLGVWSKPGAGFVCIEPWHGYAAPEGFGGELIDKEGSLRLAAGAQAIFSITVTISE